MAQRLGISGFSSFIVLTGICQYTTLGIELGLNHAAVSQLSRTACVENRKLIFSEVFYLKAALSLVLCILISLVVGYSAVAKMASTAEMAILLLGPSLTCVTFPAWFFTSMNRQDLIFRINFISRLILVGLCLWLIQGPTDYLLGAVLFNYAMVPLSIFYSRNWTSHILPLREIRFFNLKKRLVDGLMLSGVMLKETVMNIGVAPLYGVLVTDSTLGIYAFAEKIGKTIVAPAPSVANVLMVNSANNQAGWPWSRVSDKRLWLTFALIVVAACIFFAIAIELVVRHFFGRFTDSIPLIYIIVSVSPIVYFNHIEIALTFTGKGKFSTATLFAYVHMVALSISAVILSQFFGSRGLSGALVLPELVLAALLLKHKKLKQV